MNCAVVLLSPDINFCVQKSSALVPTQIPNTSSYISDVHCNIINPLVSRSSSCYLFLSLIKRFYIFTPFSHFLPYVIIPIALSERNVVWRSWSCCLCSPWSPFRPGNLLLCLIKFGLSSYVDGRGEHSQPYRCTGNIQILFIFTFSLWELARRQIFLDGILAKIA